MGARNAVPVQPRATVNRRATSCALLNSKIDHHVRTRATATDQDVSFSRSIQRLGLVRHGTGDQSALAVVTDAGTAGPPDGHITSLCKFEQALAVAAPRRGNPAACERYKRPGAGL